MVKICILHRRFVGTIFTTVLKLFDLKCSKITSFD